ncbi:MAG: T9SS type A sorting domain-containing protein [Bacteroidota bacterium]
MRLLVLLASAMLAAPALAQTPGSCTPGTAERFLDASNVQASLFTNGNLFFGGSTTSGDGYLVPKISGNSPLFAAGIWLSGTVNGEIRVAAARYGGYDFWPGPLNDDGTLPNPADCSAYDRIWVVNAFDLEAVDKGESPARDLAEWPVGLGAPTVDADGEPVAITSREQVIDLAAGERPELLGSQMAFWVMNDAGNDHNPGTPLGVEVQATAFVTVEDALPGAQDATFYRFRIVNRSPNTIENARWSFFTDPDLGDAGDDYVGTDTLRNMAFVYNDSNEDAAYGSPPPAVGYDILNHELVATSTFLGGGPSGTNDPGTPEEYYFYMQGLWGNGTPYYELNYGFEQTGAPTTTFMFPGDPPTQSFWSEVNVDGNGTDNPQGDRRLVATASFGDLAPGEAETVDLAIVFAFGSDNLDSITQIRAVSDGVQAAYDAGELFQRGPAPRRLAAPVLRSPDDGADLVQADTVRFAWDAVAGAEAYEIRWGPQPDDLTTGHRLVADTSIVLQPGGLTPTPGTRSVYWAVNALASGALGLRSTPRSLRAYQGGLLSLSDGSYAFVEVSGPDGTDPCAETAQSRDGCDEVAGNLVYDSFNSTGDYYLSEQGTGSQSVIGQYAPNDFEIRFTDTGSLGYWRFQEHGVLRVPFEIWDIGTVTPGEANDPADDVQLIPVFFADNGGTCAFDPAEIDPAPIEGYVASDRVYAYYPTTSYADFEAQFDPLVIAAPDQCYIDGASSAEANAYTTGTRPIQRQVFGSSSDAPMLPATGTVIRIYTTDPPPVSEEASPQAGDLRLGAPYPNPTASSLTIPYTLARSGPVELTMVDVLGRRVLERTTLRQLEGSHTATLDARALAPGVYVIRLRAGDETRTARITVVR